MTAAHLERCSMTLWSMWHLPGGGCPTPVGCWRGWGWLLPTPTPAICSHSWHPWRWSVYHWVQVGPWCFEWLAGGGVTGAPLGWRSHRRPAGKLLPSAGSCRCV